MSLGASATSLAIPEGSDLADWLFSCASQWDA